MFHCKLITKGTKANGMDKCKNESEDAAHAMADNGIGYTISACCAPSDSENTQHSTVYVQHSSWTHVVHWINNLGEYCKRNHICLDLWLKIVYLYWFAAELNVNRVHSRWCVLSVFSVSSNMHCSHNNLPSLLGMTAWNDSAFSSRSGQQFSLREFFAPSEVKSIC